jgi:AcrR family transcriptional regulator
MASPKSSELPSAPLHWVKPPQQARSQKTLERLLDTAEELVAESGATAFTVSDLVKRGGSSVGAFYARFPDKDALLATLHQRSCAEALATADDALNPARWEASSIEDVVSALIEFMIATCEQRRGLLVAFIALAASDTSYADRRARLEVQTAECLHRLFASRADELAHPDLETAATVTTRIVLSTLEYGVLMHPPKTDARPLPQVRMGPELTRAILGYLGNPVSRRRSAPPA